MSNNKLAYVASPYAGDVEQSVRFVKAACRYTMEQGATPIAVRLLHSQLLDDGTHAECEVGLQMGLRVLEACDELRVCGMHISKGMKAEIFAAGRVGIPVHRPPNISLEVPEQNYAMVMGCRRWAARSIGSEGLRWQPPVMGLHLYGPARSKRFPWR